MTSTGALAADDTVVLGVKVPSRLVEQAVDLGTRVPKGQVIARIDQADYALRVEQRNRDRLRPILMTTLALVAGMLPLWVGTGRGAEERGLLSVAPAGAQAPAPPPAYGTPISLEQAKKVMAGAETEAKKNNWPVVIAILDSGGQLVMLHRLDNAQWGSVEIAKEKARSAVALRRPAKALQDLIAQGGANLCLLNIGYSVLEGGIPIVVDGKVVGAVGVSGVTSQQDAQIAQAGIDSLK